MEPQKTHGATLPQQDLTRPVEGCLSGLRPADLLQGGREGANPHVGSRVADYEAVDNATAGALQPPGVSEITQGELTRLEAFNLLTKLAKDEGSKFRPIDIDFTKRTVAILRALNMPISYKDNKQVKIVISNFTAKCEKLYKKCKYSTKCFTKKHHKWLKENFKSDFPKNIESDMEQVDPELELISISEPIPELEPICEPNPNSELGFMSISEPSTELELTCEYGFITEPEDIIESELIPISEPGPSSKYNTLCERQKRRLRRSLQDSLDIEPQPKLVKVFSSIVEVGGHKLQTTASKNLQFVINTCLKSPTKSTKIATQIRNHKPQPYTPEEALAIYIDRKFTVETYHFLQQDLKSRGYSAFPPYRQVHVAKKLCYPTPPVQVSEREAFVTLYGLLSHTFSRLVLSCEDIISSYCSQKNTETLNCIFEGSWGFDGSTGQSFYKQSFSEDREDENSLFATTFIPLRITTDTGQILWMNPTPQSYRFCRPLHIQYRKESKNVILAEKKWVDDQIKEIDSICVKLSKNLTLTAKIQLYLTIIDGKVLNIITHTSSQLRCPFCKATSSQFNKLDIVLSQASDESLMKYGISPLHAWIRVLEFLLHLGYKMQVKKWRIPHNSPEHIIVEETKKKVQQEVREKMGLLVDVVRPNAGTTNDGNTARIALSNKNRGTFADILNIPQWLLDDLFTILVVLSCGLPVDIEKFGDFCMSLAIKYVQNFEWYPMTVTLHKILVHGKDIMRNSAMPVGLLSEQAGEARNKFWRSDREHHTRKFDRVTTMTDLFNRALLTSDPFISNVRLKQRQAKLRRMPLPPAVLQLLKPYEIPREEVAVQDSDSLSDEEDVMQNLIEGWNDDSTEFLPTENDN